MSDVVERLRGVAQMGRTSEQRELAMLAADAIESHRAALRLAVEAMEWLKSGWHSAINRQPHPAQEMLANVDAALAACRKEIGDE